MLTIRRVLCIVSLKCLIMRLLGKILLHNFISGNMIRISNIYGVGSRLERRRIWFFCSRILFLCKHFWHIILLRLDFSFNFIRRKLQRLYVFFVQRQLGVGIKF